MLCVRRASAAAAVRGRGYCSATKHLATGGNSFPAIDGLFIATSTLRIGHRKPS
jgi:hypothetical protein